MKKTIRHGRKGSEAAQTDGETLFLFLGWKKRYHENDYTTKCNLPIQCDPYQITNAIFHRTRTKSSTFHVATLIINSNLVDWGPGPGTFISNKFPGDAAAAAADPKTSCCPAPSLIDMKLFI